MEATHGARGPALRGAPASSERASFPAAKRHRAPAPARALLRDVSPAPGLPDRGRCGARSRRHRPSTWKVLSWMLTALTPQTRLCRVRLGVNHLGTPAVDSRWLGVRQGPEGFLPPLAAPPPLAGPLRAPGPAPSPPVRSSLLFNVSIPRRTLHLPSSRPRALCPLGVRLSLQQARGPRRGSRSFSTTRLLGSLRKPSPPS